MLWWDEETINKTVNRPFICAQLLDDEALKLDQAPFGSDGLTDDTYLDWILSKARRLFLVLVDVGVPDQIFGVIDDSWNDDDLPLPLDEVYRLRLTPDRDPKLEKRFFERQFIYMLRTLEKGEHVLYDKHDVIPLTVIEKRPARLSSNNFLDKVHLPSRPDETFLRRRLPLGDSQYNVIPEDLLAGIEQMKRVAHKHVESYWASYVQNDIGYILLTPVPDGTLKSVMTIIPPSLNILDKRDKRVLFLNWLHCLANSLAFLHSHGQPHRSIKPSNILISNYNEITLSNCSPFAGLGETKVFDKELYDYAAPEQWSRSTPSSHQPTRNTPPSTTPIRPASISPTLIGDNVSIFMSSASSMLSNNTSNSSNSSTSTLGRSDPFISDIFALGCIFLEIITVLLKRTSHSFHSHRCAKNRQAGRGGGLPDASFHKNIGQVKAWIQILNKDATKKDDKLLKGIPEILNLVSEMLNMDATTRPSAGAVSNKLGDILARICEIKDLCCPAYNSQWDIMSGIATLTMGLASMKPPSASLSPTLSKLPPTSKSPLDSPSSLVSSTGSTSSSSIPRSDGTKSLASKHISSSPSGSATSATSARTACSSTDAKATRPRRFASGGGRTAPPKSVLKAWSAPGSAGQFHLPVIHLKTAVTNNPIEGTPSEKRNDNEKDKTDNDSDDNKSMWKLRLHDYENGTVKAVGWEELG